MSESGAIFTCVLGASLIAPVPLFAQAADTTTRVTFGAFVDGYYAWDRGRPTMFDRSFAGGAPFTTQPARHNEFNVNLAYVEAVVAVPRVRGRVALQAGTSVQANYAAEPTQGTVSGPSLARHLQEAYAGWQLAPRLWLDAGIFYSHMGVESWASKDNPSYTRSLVADYSPYYSAGVRAMWEVVPSLTARFDIVNGWQNVSETNQDKGGGLRLDWRAAPGTTLTYYGFVNGEAGGRLIDQQQLGPRDHQHADLEPLALSMAEMPAFAGTAVDQPHSGQDPLDRVAVVGAVAGHARFALRWLRFVLLRCSRIGGRLGGLIFVVLLRRLRRRRAIR